MKARYLSLLSLTILLSFPLHAAGADGAWMADFEKAWKVTVAASSGPLSPGGLALSLAAKVGASELTSLEAGLAAKLAYSLAHAIEADLRKGLTYQDAMARSTQAARLLSRDASSGGNRGMAGLQRVRSRTGFLLGRARAEGLADPFGTGRPGSIHGGAGMR
jgi:hypothetical protein